MSTFYINYFCRQLTGDIDPFLDSIRVAFLKSTYTPNIKTHIFWSQVSSHEVSGLNYPAGGIPVSPKSVECDLDNRVAVVDAEDSTFDKISVSGIRYAVLYKRTDDDADSPLILYHDFVTDRTFTNKDLIVQWAVDGILRLCIGTCP